METETPTTDAQIAEETPKQEQAVKRGRGRPKGSKNKPKIVATENT